MLEDSQCPPENSDRNHLLPEGTGSSPALHCWHGIRRGGRISHSSHRPARWKAGLSFAVLAALLLTAVVPTVGAEPVTAGYRDFYFGPTVHGGNTGEKPESKLWWNGGIWWGCLWDTTAKSFMIHRFDLGTQSWLRTGVKVDPRASTRSDALWDGNRLYIATHVFTSSSGPTSISNYSRLYRYSYEPTSQTYSLDPGFPVTLNTSRTETLTLNKDSSGRLWATWMERGIVKVNRTLGSDMTWGTPFNLPVQVDTANADDISSLAAIGSNRIGLMWSDQRTKKMYFAVHLDGNADTAWEPRETALSDPVLGQVADDHINLKLSCDASGNLYAVTKTGLTNLQAPLVYVLRREPSGTWTRHVFGLKAQEHTRPQLLLDADAGRVYVFAHSLKTGRGIIYMKSASTTDMQFPAGFGTPFIESALDNDINDPSSTKQCVNGSTGLLVLASDGTSRHYFHNFLDLGGTSPVIASFTPASGLVGAEVTLRGHRLGGTTEVAFNGTAAATIFVDSDSVVRATVPSGATTGPIRVTTPGGVTQTATSFTILVAPTIASFDPTSGQVGTAVTLSGTGFTGVSEVTFAGTVATGFIIDNDTRIRANVPTGAITGKILVTNGAGSVESAQDFVVLPPPPTRVFRAVHDTQVKSSEPTKMYGQNATLRVESEGSTIYRSFLKFDVTGLGDAHVEQAKLRLYVTDASDRGGAIHLVSNHYGGTTTPWVENGVNWYNVPAIQNAALDSLGPVAIGTWVELNVTPAVTGEGTYSFACRTNSSNKAMFSSDEGLNPPQLVLTVATTGTSASSDPTPLGVEPGAIALYPNYPNPFRDGTAVSFELPLAAPVQLAVYDATGRVVRKLVESELPAGRHQARWDGRDTDGRPVSNGMYFLRLETPGQSRTHKIVRIH